MGGLVNSKLLDSYFDGETVASADFLLKLYDFFCFRVSERIVLARAQLRLGEFGMFKEHLHALKNAFLNVGAAVVAEECEHLDFWVKRLTEEQVQSGLDFLEDRAEEVKVELKEIIQGRL